MVDDLGVEDYNLKEDSKKTLINRKLSELFQNLNSRNRIIHEFLIWFGEMEKQNWNGSGKKKA